MVSETKATSDTGLHQYESISSLVPLKCIPSINSANIRQYRSGNNISTREKFHHYSPESSIRSNNENDQKFSNNYLINTHFPIAHIQQDSMVLSKTSSSFQSPTVPKQAGTFLHRLVNKFLSMTNTNRTRVKRKPRNKNLSGNSHLFVNITSKKSNRQRIKPTIRKNPPNQHCHICRQYRNYFSMLPTDSLECPSQSPMIFNSNATNTPKNPSVLTHKPSVSLPKNQFEKLRNLNQRQCQTIASAIQLIFDTLISNYQSF